MDTYLPHIVTAVGLIGGLLGVYGRLASQLRAHAQKAEKAAAREAVQERRLDEHDERFKRHEQQLDDGRRTFREIHEDLAEIKGDVKVLISHAKGAE